jgi:hypothetical protein
MAKLPLPLQDESRGRQPRSLQRQACDEQDSDGEDETCDVQTAGYRQHERNRRDEYDEQPQHPGSVLPQLSELFAHSYSAV